MTRRHSSPARCSITCGTLLAALLLACSSGPSTGSGAAPAGKPAAATPAAGDAAPRTSAPTAASAPPAAAPEPATVRAGVLGSLGDAAITIGMEMGYYAEQGITIETVSFDSGARMLPPLSQGQLEVGHGVVGAGTMNAIARGVELRAIQAASSSPPGHGVANYIVRKDLVGQIQSPADLRGRRLGTTSVGTGIEVEWAELLARGGLSPADVELVQLSFADQLTALANGALDVISPSEPTATLARDRGLGDVWLRSDEIIPYHQMSFYYAAPQFVAQTDVARRFAVAALKAVRLYNDAMIKGDPSARDQVIPIFIKHTPVKDRGLYDRMVFQGIDPDGRIHRESVERDMQYYLATGQIQAPIDLDRLIDTRFTDHAVQVLGPYPR